MPHQSSYTKSEKGELKKKGVAKGTKAAHAALSKKKKRSSDTGMLYT